jgi:hypothetical protein
MVKKRSRSKTSRKRSGFKKSLRRKSGNKSNSRKSRSIRGGSPSLHGGGWFSKAATGALLASQAVPVTNMHPVTDNPQVKDLISEKNIYSLKGFRDGQNNQPHVFSDNATHVSELPSTYSNIEGQQTWDDYENNRFKASLSADKGLSVHMDGSSTQSSKYRRHDYYDAYTNFEEYAKQFKPLKKDAVVYRGTPSRYLNGPDGDVYDYPALLWTSTSPAIANEYGDVMMEIHVPEGTSVNFQGANVLLPAGTVMERNSKYDKVWNGKKVFGYDVTDTWRLKANRGYLNILREHKEKAWQEYMNNQNHLPVAAVMDTHSQ